MLINIAQRTNLASKYVTTRCNRKKRRKGEEKKTSRDHERALEIGLAFAGGPKIRNSVHAASVPKRRLPRARVFRHLVSLKPIRRSAPVYADIKMPHQPVSPLHRRSVPPTSSSIRKPTWCSAHEDDEDDNEEQADHRTLLWSSDRSLRATPEILRARDNFHTHCGPSADSER